MVRKERADMLCIQETKKEQVDNYICQALWGNTDVKWEMQPAVSRAGGLICLWNESSFRLDRKVCGQGFIYLEGIWVPDAHRMAIVNIYAPCDMIQKRNLWGQITQLKALNPDVLWCILGDFNNIQTAKERVGLSQRRVNDATMDEFNEWIENIQVEEVPCAGRKFTWYKPNGTAKSRLDRFLVTADWLSKMARFHTVYSGKKFLGSLSGLAKIRNC